MLSPLKTVGKDGANLYGMNSIRFGGMNSISLPHVGWLFLLIHLGNQ